MLLLQMTRLLILKHNFDVINVLLVTLVGDMHDVSHVHIPRAPVGRVIRVALGERGLKERGSIVSLRVARCNCASYFLRFVLIVAR